MKETWSRKGVEYLIWSCKDELVGGKGKREERFVSLEQIT